MDANKTYELEQLELIKKEAYNILNIDVKTARMCMYAFLQNYELIKYKDIEDGVKDFIQNEKLEDVVFYNGLVFKYKALELFNEDKYDFINLNILSLTYLSDFLINNNSKNHFILSTMTDMELLKSLAASDNELILIGMTINDIHKKLADKTIQLAI